MKGMGGQGKKEGLAVKGGVDDWWVWDCKVELGRDWLIFAPNSLISRFSLFCPVVLLVCDCLNNCAGRGRGITMQLMNIKRRHSWVSLNQSANQSPQPASR